MGCCSAVVNQTGMIGASLLLAFLFMRSRTSETWPNILERAADGLKIKKADIRTEDVIRRLSAKRS